MEITEVARQLVDVATRRGHAVLRCDDTTPIGQLRAEVRSVAARRGVHVRTGLIDDVLAVIPTNADLWHASADDMRRQLCAPAECNIVA